MKRATIDFNAFQAAQAGEQRHAQIVVREFAHRHDMRVTEATFHSIPGAWSFEVETDAKEMPTIPPYMTARPHR